MNVAGFEIKKVDLIKRVFFLALALKDQRFPVRRKIAFATPGAFKRELPDICQEIGGCAYFGKPNKTNCQTNQRAPEHGCEYSRYAVERTGRFAVVEGRRQRCAGTA